MVAIITGDIVNSREGEAAEWLETLKEALNAYGKNAIDWEIFRGDSFQLKTKVNKALEASLFIKACIKEHSAIDVRMAIGIGQVNGSNGKIIEDQGEAFYRSGYRFENLKSTRLAVETGDQELDSSLNLMLDIGLLTFDNWTKIDALTLKTALKFPEYTQKQIAKTLDKSPSTVSFTLQKTGFKEILKLLEFYNHSVSKL